MDRCLTGYPQITTRVCECYGDGGCLHSMLWYTQMHTYSNSVVPHDKPFPSTSKLETSGLVSYRGICSLITSMYIGQLLHILCACCIPHVWCQSFATTQHNIIEVYHFCCLLLEEEEQIRPVVIFHNQYTPDVLLSYLWT